MKNIQRNLSSRHLGFTLIEMMIVVVMMGIVMGIATPYARDMIYDSRETAMSESLLSGLNYARNTALSQGVPVRVCPYNAANVGASAGALPQCGQSWQAGWIVIANPGVQNKATIVLSRQTPAQSNGPVLSMLSGAALVDFSPRGINMNNNDFRFAICDSRGAAHGTSVWVSPTGFVQVAQQRGISAWDGSSLTCTA